MRSKKNVVIVVGAGFAGISAAANLAQKGFKVTLIEKHTIPGGRARKFLAEGFTFDMGPSWYWMPDIFDEWFIHLGKSSSDYYELIRLDPSYRVFFDVNDHLDIPANISALGNLFESIEPGAAANLQKFIKEASFKYRLGMKKLVNQPGLSITEFLNPTLLFNLLRMDVFTPFDKHIRKYFNHPKLHRLLEFPILFLGATPQKTPALYSFMNYADINLGTWYPKGGFHEVIAGMVSLATEKGVQFNFGEEAKKLVVADNNATHLITDKNTYTADVVVSGTDYHHFENELIPEHLRNYDDAYWESRVMAPSALIFFLGIKGKINKLLHHNLFFHEDFTLHAQEIYDNPKWPTKPLFYVCVPSKTDPTVAPENCENLFVLMPVAPGIEDDLSRREHYFELIMNKLETFTGEEIKNRVIYKNSYAHRNFQEDYHAYKGNAYGLANTLNQTAIKKPSIRSKKVKNLFFTGQLTVPGPGVPPSLISGRLVAEQVEKNMRS